MAEGCRGRPDLTRPDDPAAGQPVPAARPFTAAILVLEMTDRHSAIFQLLISGLLAQGVASLLDPHSLYEHLKAGFIREATAAERPATGAAAPAT